MTERKPWGYVTDAGKVVRKDVLEEYATKAESRQITTQRMFEDVSGLVAPKYDPAQLAGLLEANTAHYASCRQRAQDAAGLGWRVDRVDDDADAADKERLEAFFSEQRAANALEQGGMSQALTAAALDFESTGRGVLEVLRTDNRARGDPEKLVHMPAHTVRVHRDGVRFVQHRGGRKRWFKWLGADLDVHGDTGEIHAFDSLSPDRRANEVVWWRNYHPLDTIYGMPDIIPAIGALLGDLGRRDYNLEFFSNWGIPAYAVFVTGDFDPGETVNEDGDPDPDGMTELEWHVQKLLKQVRENPHSSLVFTVPTREGAEDGEVKIEFRPLATDTKEASFRLYRKDNREEVLSSGRTSSAIAGVFDAGVANRESREHYRRSVIAPRQEGLERIINQHVVRDGFGITGWRWRLQTVETRDLQREFDMWTKMLEVGAVTLREFIRHFVEPFGLVDPGDPDDDPVLDVRRGQASAEAAEQQDQVVMALRSMRDDLVHLASNGHKEPAAP